MSAAAAPWSWLSKPPPHLAPYRLADVWRDRTVAELGRSLAMAEPDTPVFLGAERAATYGSLMADAEALCAAMTGLGLKAGDVVSFQTPNWVEACVINLAAALGGFVVNPIVAIYRDAEVRMMLADCRAKLFFVADRLGAYDFAAMVERIRPALPDLVHVAYLRSDRPDGYEALLTGGRGRTLKAPDVDPDGVKMVLYTSGTTGRPKGVLHSHNTLARAGAACVGHWGIRRGDIMLMPSPVTHVSGYSNGLELPFLAGTRTVLMETWDAEAAVTLIDRHQVAGTVAATPFLQELATAASRRGTRLASLRVFACGGAAVAPHVIHQANAAFETATAFRVFGSSEVPLVTLGYPHDPALAATTDGEVVDYEVRIVDEADRPVATGADGEILARGPSMFMGYADQGQTAEALTQDGFFRTGDIGRMTADGALVVTGRKKDLIIRGGENISAQEIEAVLAQHPGVADVAVVAMPHPRLGEGVCAFVVVREGAAVDAAALVAAVAASGLAKQKIPERFSFVDALPRTASGKVRKDVLRAEAKAAGALPSPAR